MTQPAASRLLAAIEKTLGTPVFVRHPKGMTPTPVGETLARHAVGLLNGIERTVREVDRVRSGFAGTARIGSVTGGAVAFVVPAIQELKKTASNTDIHVDVAPSDVLIEGLLNGDYDFVLSRIPAGTDARQFNIRRGRVEVLRFVVRKGHPLTGRGRIGMHDLAGFEWVIQAPPTPMRQAIEDAFVSSGVPLPGEIVNTTSLLVMISYLDATDAIAPLTQEVAELFDPDSHGSRFTALDVENPVIITPYHLIHRRDQVLSPLAERLRDLVADAISITGSAPAPEKD
jgi:DNA-binding transcriptional LysR family regulator